MIAPPDLTRVVIGIAGPAALPWKNVAEFCLAFKTPPLKFKVAVGFTPLDGGPLCELAGAVPTRFTASIPPSTLTVPSLPPSFPFPPPQTTRLPHPTTPAPPTPSIPPPLP